MQKTQNLFYRWEVLQNLAEYLTLKDLLNTATLSKEYNLLLRKYLKQEYSLSNNANQTQFNQLKTIFNRKIFTYHKGDKNIKAHPSNVILRNIRSFDDFSLAQTLDGSYKIIPTRSIYKGEALVLKDLPQKYTNISLSEDIYLYASNQQTLHRYTIHLVQFEPQTLELKGNIQNIAAGLNYTLVTVRQKPDSVKILIFENDKSLENYKQIQLPFQILSISKESIIVGKNMFLFLYNDELYAVNPKQGSIYRHPEFIGKKIVKIIGGKLHYMAYERTQELSINWGTNELVKFAQKEGFQDFIKIFQAQKVTGKILLSCDKKYLEEVIGMINVKIQQKIMLRISECNKQNPDNYILYGWGRASQGALGTNPSKEITKPIKIKLPNNCQIHSLSGFHTFIINKQTGALFYNAIDEKTNKQEWKQLTNKKVWAIQSVQDNFIMICSGAKEKVPQRLTQDIVIEKKQKLRTAKNIIDKITWDPNLNKQDFRVGYLDKYQGILQMSFEELLRSQDVKQYRIQYFKRLNEVVWDKKKRIDIL